MEPLLDKTPRVFISHAWEDKLLVRRLEDELKTEGVEIWVDHSDVRGGDRISKRVSDALEWCNVLLLIWSHSASRSKWVELEWNAAVNLQKVIIPCLLDNTTLPGILAGMAYVDFHDFQRGLASLHYSLDFSEQPIAYPLTTITEEKYKTQTMQETKAPEDRKIKILFLAANPKDTSQLRLGEEIRGIKQSLRQAEFRDNFEIEQEEAVGVAELQGHLLRHQPDIVHFSGHGSEASEIILEDNTGNSQAVSARALSQMFFVLKDNIRCVVLNACYSEQQAQAIAKYIDCVMGMSKAIGDEAAISFAAAFYQALGFGRDVKTAFDLGCVQIDLKNLNEHDTPKLLAVNVNPKEIVFAQEQLVTTNYAEKNVETSTKDSKPFSKGSIFDTPFIRALIKSPIGGIMGAFMGNWFAGSEGTWLGFGIGFLVTYLLVIVRIDWVLIFSFEFVVLSIAFVIKLLVTVWDFFKN